VKVETDADLEIGVKMALAFFKIDPADRNQLSMPFPEDVPMMELPRSCDPLMIFVKSCRGNRESAAFSRSSLSFHSFLWITIVWIILLPLLSYVHEVRGCPTNQRFMNMRQPIVAIIDVLHITWP